MSTRPEDVIANSLATYGDVFAHGKITEDRMVVLILTALRAAGFVIEPDWQPIETAPRDGRRVLFFAPAADAEHPAPRYRVDRWWASYRAWGQMRPDQPYAHWRPLPTQPQ